MPFQPAPPGGWTRWDSKYGDESPEEAAIKHFGYAAGEFRSAILGGAIGVVCFFLPGDFFTGIAAFAFMHAFLAASDWRKHLTIARQVAAYGRLAKQEGSSYVPVEELLRRYEEESFIAGLRAKVRRVLVRAREKWLNARS